MSRPPSPSPKKRRTTCGVPAGAPKVMGPAGVPEADGAVREPPEVRVARAFAAAELGTGGPCVDGERRTTVRGGSTFHASGSRGGLLPLAGRGGGGALRPPIADAQPVAAVLGAHPVAPGPRRVAVECVPASRLPPDVERRTAAPGGRPTVGTPGADPPARLIVGTPFDQDEPAAVREPGAFGIVERLVVEAAVEPALPRAAAPGPAALVLGLALALVAVARRRRGAEADRIEVEPVPAAPAVRTVTGDIMRRACPGPASSARWATGAPVDGAVPGVQAPVPAVAAERWADAYTAAAPVGGAKLPRWSPTEIGDELPGTRVARRTVLPSMPSPRHERRVRACPLRR